MEGKCYCCGKPGHKSPQCRFKDKLIEEWAIKKAATFCTISRHRDNYDNNHCIHRAISEYRINTDIKWMGRYSYPIRLCVS
jgi:hypothetical protein